MKPRSIRCLKFFLTLLNIIFILFALVVMVICIINMRDKRTKPEKQLMISYGVISFLLTLGFGLLVGAVLGCIGALRENVKILYVHAFFLIFIVSIEMIVGIGGAMLSAWLGGGNDYRVQFYKNTTVDDDGVNQAMLWKNLQSENQCCGVDGPQDYALLDREIPVSCCARAHPLREGKARKHLHATCLAEKTYYIKGCEEVLRGKKAFKGSIFISTGIIFLLLEIVCIILAICMARAVRRERKKLQQSLQAHFES